MPTAASVPAEGDLPRDLREQAAERLLAAPPAARGGVLAELLRQHPDQAEALRRLAEDLAGVERLLEQGFATVGDPRWEAPSDPLPAIGSYRVLRVIGEGAFGVVYLCAQEAPVRREVAIKVLRPGAGDRHTLARFEAERHLLATLSHPAIAHVFDAGALPDGRPYFVMEFVRGLPITAYCDQHCLGVDARLALFVRVCNGVQHAHAQGIVHRDLKPANVLAYEQDGQAQPKIIDFGIAKAMHATEARAVQTETGRVVGTPGYMSPEQAGGAGGDIDARADVFSLGVLLYELLTGELPWGRRPETTDSEPPRPSARVGSDPTGEVGRRRAAPTRRLAARLRGDLDWIVLKALAREREQRYASARELAQDLERHLRGKPVHAGPPALRYRLRKFVRRHRAGFSATVAVVLTFAVGLWFILGFRATAMARTSELEAAADSLLQRARDRALAEAPQSDAVRKALVQDALVFYDKLLRERPSAPKLREGRARALWTLSQVHWLVGENAQAETAARASAAEASALLAEAPDNVVYRGIRGNALRNVGRALASAGQADAARAALVEAVAELERCHASAPAKYAGLLVRALMEWGSTLPEPEFATRLAALRRATAIQEAMLRERPSGEARLDLVDVHCALGEVLAAGGELDAAGESFERATDLLGDTPEAKPAYACKVHHAAAGLATRRRQNALAIEHLGHAIAAARRWLDQEPTQRPPHQALVGLHGELARQHRAVGDPQAAAATYRIAIAMNEADAARFSDDAMTRGDLAYQLSELAQTLLLAGRRSVLAEAETCARRALALLATIPESVDRRLRSRARWEFAHDLACVLAARGSEEAAAQWHAAGAALAAWREGFGVQAGEATAFAGALLRLARHRVGAGLRAEAIAALDEAEATIGEHAPAIEDLGWQVAQVHHLRALLAAHRGDHALAAGEAETAVAAGEGWRVAMAGAEGMHAAWRAARSAVPDAATLAAGHRDRAIELHRAAIEALGEPRGDPWVDLPAGQARVRLAEMLADRGEVEAAKPLLARALPVLEALRDEAHADRWDEALYRAGRTLAAQ